MRLEACIVSSDSNPAYLDFYPLVHRTWRDIVGVRAILLLIAGSIPPELRKFEKDIVLVPAMPGLHPGLQAQCARLAFAPRIPATPDGAVITSDIDMLPLRPGYFRDPLRDLPSSTLAVARSAW